MVPQGHFEKTTTMKQATPSSNSSYILVIYIENMTNDYNLHKTWITKGGEGHQA